MRNEKTSTTPAALVVLAWLIVGIPATWGIYNTALNARKLFTTSAPTQPQ